MKRLVALFGVVVLLSASACFASDDFEEALEDFREWRHTKSMVISDKNHGLYGFHNIYANEKALKGLKKGEYKEGAAFVVRFYDVVEKDGMITQGAILMDAVMIKDDDAKETGNWAYGAFDEDGKSKGVDPVKDCYECHAGGAKDKDYIFHSYVK